MAFFGFSWSCFSNGKIYPNLCEAQCQDRNAFAVFRCPRRGERCDKLCAKTVSIKNNETETDKCKRLCVGRRNIACGWDGELYNNLCHANCLGVRVSFMCRQKGFIFNKEGCKDNCSRNKRPERAKLVLPEPIRTPQKSIIYEEWVEKEGINESEVMSESEYQNFLKEQEEKKKFSEKLLNQKEIKDLNESIFGSDTEEPILVSQEDIKKSEERDKVKKIEHQDNQKSESRIMRINIKPDNSTKKANLEDQNKNQENIQNNSDEKERENTQKIINTEENKTESKPVTEPKQKDSDEDQDNKNIEIPIISQSETADEGSQDSTENITTSSKFENQFGDRNGFRIKARFEGQVVIKPEKVNHLDIKDKIPESDKSILTDEPDEKAKSKKETEKSPQRKLKNPKTSIQESDLKNNQSKPKKKSEKQDPKLDFKTRPKSLPNSTQKTNTSKASKIKKLQSNKTECLRKCTNKNLSRLVCFSDGFVYLDLCTPICNGHKPQFLCGKNSSVQSCNALCSQRVLAKS